MTPQKTGKAWRIIDSLERPAERGVYQFACRGGWSRGWALSQQDDTLTAEELASALLDGAEVPDA